MGAAPEPLAPAAAGCGVPCTAEDPGLEEARAAHPQEGGRHATAARAQVCCTSRAGCWRVTGMDAQGWVGWLDWRGTNTGGESGMGGRLGRGVRGHPEGPPFPFFPSIPHFSHPYSCSGHPGAPWARGGPGSQDDWALWPPTALSQRPATASTPPGARRCSPKSKEGPSGPRCPRAAWEGGGSLADLEPPLVTPGPYPFRSLCQLPPRAWHWALTAPLAARLKPHPQGSPLPVSPPPRRLALCSLLCSGIKKQAR